MARMAPLSITLLIAGLVIGGAVGYYFTRVMWATDLDALYATQDIDLLRWELVLLRSHESQKGGYLSMEERVKLAACQHYEYATTVAAEETAAALVVNHDVVTRVTGTVQAQQRPAGQIHDMTVVSDIDALGRNRAQLTVGALHFLGAVNGGGTGHQRRGIDHVALTARMHDQPRIR